MARLIVHFIHVLAHESVPIMFEFEIQMSNKADEKGSYNRAWKSLTR